MGVKQPLGTVKKIVKDTVTGEAGKRQKKRQKRPDYSDRG